MNYQLASNDSLTSQLRDLNLFMWTDLVQFVKSLPYGRNTNRKDLSLILKEGKGSCSSKHAFLKKVADLNGIPNVELILGIYIMNNINTPKIGIALENLPFNYIPEAHCYLLIDGDRKDFTSLNSSIDTIEKDIILEKEIEPDQVSSFKVAFHKEYLKKWLKENNIESTFDEVWSAREKCIENLSK